MIEAEWAGCTEPEQLLGWLGDRVTLRKVLLCACGCCRALHWRFKDPRAWAAVEAAEQFAEGAITARALWPTATAASEAWLRAIRSQATPYGVTNACLVTMWAASDLLAPFRESEPATEAIRNAAVHAIGLVRQNVKRMKVPQAALLRDVLGNPFRPVVLDPSWRTPVVLALGTAAYEDRALPAGTLSPDRLAVLADALEEGGCTHEALLTHLGGPGTHIRGCWAVDLILGKQ